MTINRITQTDVDLIRLTGNLNDYQQAATKSAFYPGQGTALGLIYVALKLNGEAGELAEHVGKAMRDDELIEVGEQVESDGTCTAIYAQLGPAKPLTPERRALIIKEVGDNLWYLSAICNELGITLAEAATTNLRKLKDRTDRDKLSGSGDER
jgi:NTP pyrophosphatase (non-canonical NTP hydrolase)